ncbi:MAG: hypothetical protein WKG00_08245 [Polyangiaceae bacterium]
MNRRTFLGGCLASAALCVAAPAQAGSYLDRAALLLDQSRKEGDMLQPRTYDKELATMIRALAEARNKAARGMEVPAAIAKAHPHLMMVLENWERAVESALAGNFKRFMEHLTICRNEDQAFRALVAELGFTVPNLSPRK